MRQHTNKEQTQHLIELGFPKPQYILDTYWDCDECCVDYETAYSIGELIEFIGWDKGLLISSEKITPTVDYHYIEIGPKNRLYYGNDGELIDALYMMCVKLKTL